MLLQFTLSMPNVGSWNGRWTGEDNFYARVRFFRVNRKAIAERILKKGYYHYNFGDGWSAGITIKRIDSREAAKVRKKSIGFSGYEWMIDSIIQNDMITTKKVCQ